MTPHQVHAFSIAAPREITQTTLNADWHEPRVAFSFAEKLGKRVDGCPPRHSESWRAADAGVCRIAAVAYKPDHDQSPEATPELLVPKRSADPETAGLSVTVVAGQTTTADLVLNAE